MKLLQWSYTQKHQIKAIFDSFPDMIIIFRSVGNYYFVFTTKGSVTITSPNRKDYVEMELLINLELGKLTSYMNRKNSVEVAFMKSWVQKKELPTSISLEVFPYTN